MKKTRNFRILFALLGTMAPLWMCQAQTTFFSDNFSSSTTNGVSIPGGTPTPSSTSYDIASTKTSVTTIGPNLLHMTLSTATTSGFLEAQALFATNPISLNVVGDYIEIAVVVTNSANTFFSGTGVGSALWLGLFNSGSTFGVQTNWPVPSAGLANGGLTTAQGNAVGTGFCQLWQGYVGQILSNSAPQIITRPIQNGTSTASANQELLGNGVGSGAFTNPKGAGISSGAVSNITLATTGAYTWDLRITLSGAQVLTISNAIFLGPNTGGTIVYSQVTTNVTGANFLTQAFDGMGFGLRSAGSTAENPVIDISSILISGQSTLPTTPPIVTLQPVNTTVTTNGSCAFITAAIGEDVQYQWFRNLNQKLTDGGNISGSKTPQLIISPAGTGDQLTGVNNGYYCICSQGAVPSLKISTTTNTLTLINLTNLVWNDASTVSNAWDVNNTVNWQDTNGNVSVFNFGDPVTFDETGLGGEVNLFANYLSPSQVTVNTVSSTYTFDGSGSIAGPCSFDYIGSGEIKLNCVNTFTGGMLISNSAANVLLENYAGLGAGSVTLGKAGGQIEFTVAGSATTGIEGNVVVADNFSFLPDTDQSFSLVMLGNLSGTSGKTLTISPAAANPNTNQIRIRLYGGNTTYNGNLALTDPNILFASYQASGTQTFNGVISGPGGFIEKGITTDFNGPNTYSGGTIPAQGAIGLGVSSVGSPGSLTSGPLGTGPILLTVDSSSSLTGNGFIFATVNNLTLGNAIQNVSGTNNCILDIGGSDNITLTGPFTLYGNDRSVMTAFPTRSLQVTNTGLTTLNGVISDAGSNYNFNLTGNGVTIFNTTEAYGGITTNNGGTLLVNGQLGSGAVVILTNAATTGGSNSIAMLGGSGIINGSVSIQAGGTLTSGSQTTAGTQNIGTLTINNSVTFLGGSKAYVLVNKTANTHSLVNVNGSLTYNGTLVATNISGTSVIGDQYTVFSVTPGPGGTGNFTNIVGTPGPGLAWSFAPASGVLSVVAGPGPTPFTVPPHISTITLTGTNLTVTGTNAQSGSLYYMLTSTNLQTPLPQWTPVGTNVAPGANNFSFTITNAVNPKDAQQFYIFSSTNF